jgi:hypothetical protein
MGALFSFSAALLAVGAREGARYEEDGVTSGSLLSVPRRCSVRRDGVTSGCTAIRAAKVLVLGTEKLA